MPSVLLLIDLQKNMLLPPEPVPAAARVIKAVDALLERARAAGVPVVHVRDNEARDEQDHPGTPGRELYHPPLQGEAVVDKLESDAFAGTALGEFLPAGSTLVIAGLASNSCVRATALSALRLGYPVRLVHGAHAAHDEGGRSAADIELGVEMELAAVGASVVELHSRVFGGGPTRR